MYKTGPNTPQNLLDPLTTSSRGTMIFQFLANTHRPFFSTDSAVKSVNRV